jgi:hypothetical protein
VFYVHRLISIEKCINDYHEIIIRVPIYPSLAQWFKWQLVSHRVPIMEVLAHWICDVVSGPCQDASQLASFLVWTKRESILMV